MSDRPVLGPCQSDVTCHTRTPAHKIPRCIEWVSSIHPLEPGDVFATGTNHRGLSAFQNGDRIDLETDGLGRLRLDVRDDLKRTWAVPSVPGRPVSMGDYVMGMGATRGATAAGGR